MSSFPDPLLGAGATDRKIIVAIDYGTTYTGVSYVGSKASELKDITVIDGWPGSRQNTSYVLKVPSRIAYAAENERTIADLWGFQVQPGMSACSWTKLLLDENTSLTEFDDRSLDEASGAGILRLPAGKTAVDVVADYLTYIYKHIMYTLARHMTPPDLAITPIEFWFTVPAIWSDQAKDVTRTAARRAGFASSRDRPCDRLFFISEPEAAAITALTKDGIEGVGASVKAGDGVLVCDCGGGTVDITAYVVENVFPAVTFHELLTGIGGKCGSTAIDRNLYKLMSHRFGRAFDNLPTSVKGPGSKFMNAFENVKRDFGISSSFSIEELPLNMTLTNGTPTEYYDAEERLVKITSGDLSALFDPVVNQVITLIQRQITDARNLRGRGIINRIILVGGFGNSEYLQKAIKSTFATTGEIAVTNPTDPQAAIVQGAALRGLEGIRPSTKRCRRHYGFARGIPFREGHDDEKNSYIDAFDGIKRVGGIVKWMIAKGESYAENYKQTAYVHWTHWSCESLKKHSNFYAYDEMLAPERKDDVGVYRVGRIIVDFSQVDLSRFPVKEKDGDKVYKLEYNIRVTFGARDGLLKFEAISQGKTIGETSIEFTTN
ncbi:Hsp70 family protein [Aspergillus aculeatinus CBS 121060]|uniref:Actin-like ATPase domain-containing protein n=1 Tax=Aspergillus aculeatinus CBS 121060 TaxID=1448322 RepID=A0ACD1GTR1_9EURO|nr:actin-like ATPase domain-containing protein [Aspergillus aculeatinus CBS 121060]RAH64719.1 actin-like ATPase domain-containing protein [Aspergillus aculeatinus CBS 121060]